MRRAITLLGALNFVVLMAHAALSWVEAGAATYAARPHGQVVFYNELGARVADFVARQAPALLLTARPGEAQAITVGDVTYPAADREDRLRRGTKDLTYAIGGDWVQADEFLEFHAIPLVLSTLLALGALFFVVRTDAGNSPALPRVVRRWAIAFVVVMGFAMPVLVPDFWLSFAWGRTLWWGGNPYYEVPAAAVAGLPFDAPILKMTYGPLWALISWGIAAITQGSVLWSTILFKGLLVGCWVALLFVVHRLTSDRSPREQAVALLVVGWLPLGVVQVGGDGHNDVLMVLGIMGWLLLNREGHAKWATASLAMSVATKYVSAPLFLLDLLHTRVPGVERPTLLQRIRAYVPQGLIAVAIWVVSFAPFVRSPAFFAETTAVREGYFFLPADAVKAIGTLTGLPLRPLAFLVMGLFPLVTLLLVWRYWRTPSTATLYQAVAGIMLTVLFVAAAHVWPWYVLWLAVPAVLLARDSLLSRWSMGVLLTAPFPLLYWTAYPDGSDHLKFELPSLVAYGLALGWMLLGWRLLQPRAEVDGARPHAVVSNGSRVRPT